MFNRSFHRDRTDLQSHREPRILTFNDNWRPKRSGKSTISEFLIRLGIFQTFINADTVAMGLSGQGAKALEVQAGKAMLHRLHDGLKSKETMAFETTLSGRTWLNMIKIAKAQTSGVDFQDHTTCFGIITVITLTSGLFLITQMVTRFLYLIT